MTSWQDPPRIRAARLGRIESGVKRTQRREWVGIVALACSVPALFFSLDFLLSWIAGLLA